MSKNVKTQNQTVSLSKNNSARNCEIFGGSHAYVWTKSIFSCFWSHVCSETICYVVLVSFGPSYHLRHTLLCIYQHINQYLKVKKKW